MKTMSMILVFVSVVSYNSVQAEERSASRKTLDKKTTVDLKTWPKNSIRGATVKRLSGVKAGLPVNSLPGVKFVSTNEIKQMDINKQKTGLFLVDIDFIPRDLADALKHFKYTLRRDGTLVDDQGEPILAVISSETYSVQKETTGSRLSSLIISEAQAANPFPWRCYSFSPWAVYHSGFHRWYSISVFRSSEKPSQRKRLNS